MAVSATEQEIAGARERSLPTERAGGGREAWWGGRETCEGGAGVPGQLVASLTCPCQGGEARRAGVLLAHASEEFAERLQGEVLLLLEHDQ